MLSTEGIILEATSAVNVTVSVAALPSVVLPLTLRLPPITLLPVVLMLTPTDILPVTVASSSTCNVSIVAVPSRNKLFHCSEVVPKLYPALVLGTKSEPARALNVTVSVVESPIVTSPFNAVLFATVSVLSSTAAPVTSNVPAKSAFAPVKVIAVVLPLLSIKLPELLVNVA